MSNAKTNTHLATLNELFLGKSLIGSYNKFVQPQEYIKSRMDFSKSFFKQTEIHCIETVSNNMAKEIVKYMKHHPFYDPETITTISYTATENHLNPADLELEFSNGRKLGISCKCVSNSFKTTFKNYSLVTLCKHLDNEELICSIKEYEELVCKEYELSDLSNIARKKYIRSNDALRELLVPYNDIKFKLIRDELLNSLSKKQNVNEYFLKEWFGLDMHTDRYIKVIGNYSNGAVMIDDPFIKTRRTLYNTANITFAPRGNSGIEVLYNDNSVFTIYIKNNSEMFCSSVVAIAKPTGTNV